MEVPVPPQDCRPHTTDFRTIALGPKGYRVSRKRKLDEQEEQARADAAAMEDSEPVVVPPAAKRSKQNTWGLGQASGRPWKVASERASSLRSPQLGTSWEKKMAAKEESRVFKAAKAEAVEARKAKATRARKQREEGKARKAENQKKAMITQKITNPATLKRMMKSKKDHKKLMKSDTV